MTRHGEPLPARSKRPVTGDSPLRLDEAPRRTVARRRRRLISPLTRRILTINILALAIPVAGLLYLGEYRESLIVTKLGALETQARIFAEALGEGAVGTDVDGTQSLREPVARPLLRRLVQPTRTRARLFSVTGDVIADSRFLIGPGGLVQIESLPPPEQHGLFLGLVLDFYDVALSWIPGQRRPSRYTEKAVQQASDYAEVLAALNGDSDGTVRRRDNGALVLSAAVPVQRFKRILGAVMLTTGGVDI